MNVFIVAVAEDGPLGVTELEVPTPGSIGVGCAYCDTFLDGERNEVIGWFYDGYSGGVAFCHKHILDPTNHGVSDIRFFATRELADAFVDGWHAT